MASKLKNLAKKALILSELMEGREKISTEDIIKYYPNGITITAYDGPIKTENGETVIYIFKEEKDKFAFGGTIMQSLFNRLVVSYEGDIGALKADLAKEGLKVKLGETENKSGQTMTSVEIVD